MHNYQHFLADSNLDLFSAMTGALAYFMLAGVDLTLLMRRVMPHSNIWLAQSLMFLVRGGSLLVATANHFSPIPELLTYSRLAASAVSIGVAVFHVIVLPDLMRWFRTRKEDLAMNTEVLADIRKANELSATLASMNYERAKGFLGDVA